MASIGWVWSLLRWGITKQVKLAQVGDAIEAARNVKSNP
jgi:hypothetical protein